MKVLSAAVLIFAATLSNLVAPAFARSDTTALQPRSSSELIALLPASDLIAVIDVRRVFSDAIPQLLGANQPLLAEVTAAIADLQRKSGIDFRQFESLAAGMSLKNTSPTALDIDPVVIARGQLNVPALIAAAKLALNGKYRRERVGARDLYIFAGTPATTATKTPTTRRTAISRFRSRVNEMAIAAFDANTIVVGTPARVRSTLAATTRVSSDITGLLALSDGSIVDFAARIPEGFVTALPIENDELGKNIRAIRYLYGNMSLATDAVSVRSVARTVGPEQARGLKETLDGLQLIGKAFLGSAKGGDKQVYLRMIENARISLNGTDVAFDLRVPQSDIDILIGMVK